MDLPHQGQTADAKPGPAPDVWDDAKAFTELLASTFRRAVQEAWEDQVAKGLRPRT